MVLPRKILLLQVSVDEAMHKKENLVMIISEWSIWIMDGILWQLQTELDQPSSHVKDQRLLATNR